MIIDHLEGEVVLCHEIIDIFIHSRKQKSEKNYSFNFGGSKEGLVKVGEF